MLMTDIWNTIENIESSIIISQDDLYKIDNILKTITQYTVTETDYSLLSEYYCVIGYIGYHFNSLIKNIDFISFFIKSLEFDSDNSLALRYLGHSYFDKQLWEKSLEAFKRLNLSKIPCILRVKVLELIICCKLRINKPQDIPKSVLVLIDYLKHKNPEDKIPPTELYDTVLESNYLSIMCKKQLIDLLNSEIY